MPGNLAIAVECEISGIESFLRGRGRPRADVTRVVHRHRSPNRAGATKVGSGGTGVNATSEGFVHIHRNVLGDADPTGGMSDIDSTVHRWLNPVVRVVVTVN